MSAPHPRLTAESLARDEAEIGLPAIDGGQNWTPIPRLRGSKLHADTHSKVYMPAPVPGAACPAKVSWVLVGAAKAVNSPCWAWICLLYTSDAADEL